MQKFLCLLLLVFVSPVYTAYCGTSAIPFSFEVLPNGGGTVLGCARPRCFGWEAASGEPASRDEQFQTIHGNVDGFLKQGESRVVPFLPSVQQTSICLNSASCAPDQWAAGVVHNPEGGGISLTCCNYPALFNAEDRGVAKLKEGEFYMGGELEPQTFDYIQNIVPVQNPHGISGYEVFVRRMSCIEPHPMPSLQQLSTLHQPPQPPQSILEQQVAQPSYYSGGAQASGNSPYYYPMQSYVPCMSGGSCQCFAADSTVKMLDGTEKRMDELTMDEWTIAPVELRLPMERQPLQTWLHRDPEEMAEFIVITTESGRSLKITGEHYIYRATCNRNETKTPKMVVAREIKLNDCLLEEVDAKNNKKILEPVKVTNLSKIIQKGIYAPLVDHGKIIVDGILASCYSQASDNTIVQTVITKVVTCKDADSSLRCDFERSTVSVLLQMIKLVLPNVSPF